jgi:hypothetical protein
MIAFHNADDIELIFELYKATPTGNEFIRTYSGYKQSRFWYIKPGQYVVRVYFRRDCRFDRFSIGKGDAKVIVFKNMKITVE